MNIHGSTLSYHLKNLISVDLILREKVGKNTIYQLKDPAEVVEILEQLRDGF
jgi:predicted transcriptional regulator